MNFGRTHCWRSYSLALGLELLRTDDDALVQSNWSFNRLVPGGYLEYMDGDAHGRYRRIFAAAFTQEVLADSRESITLAVRRQLAEMARSSTGDGVDQEPFLLPISLTSLLRAVLGTSADGERFDELRSLFTELNRPLDPATLPELVESARQASSAAPGARSVLAHLMQSDPTQVDDDTVAGNLILMVKEGSIMVRGLFRWLLKMLAQDPRWAEQIREVASDPLVSTRWPAALCTRRSVSMRVGTSTGACRATFGSGSTAFPRAGW